MTILVVDDDPMLREMIAMLLKRKGHHVIEAEDGQEAWELLQQEQVQLIITDRLMPRLDGQSLIRRVRAATITPYIYIVMLTALGQPQQIVDGLEAGADDYIVKPFNLRELQARVAIGVRLLTVEQELRQARDRMEILATHDDLTGLLNRKAITERAEAELKRTRREVAPMSLVLLDIDHFKSVNDQYGHLVGDDALRLIARVIDQTVRTYDYTGRWGGEEFMLVLPRTTEAEALNIAERVRIDISNTPLSLPNGKDLNLSASLGVVSTSKKHHLPLDTLFQQADEALYEAKEQGRNRVCCFVR
ncbi:MAG: GGDEF domain-containing protein [Ardenticatenaceae bacterium]